MLRLLYHSLLLATLALRCSAVCCNNKNPLCLINSQTCTPNCNDGVSLCSCPKACLNDAFGGCNGNVKCDSVNDDGHTVTVTSLTKTAYYTSTYTYYSATSQVYTSTQTVVNVVTSQSVNVVTSTSTKTQVVTLTTTLPGPQATITGRGLDFMVIRDDSHVRRGDMRPAMLQKRTTTVTYNTQDTANHCGEPTFIPCVSTKGVVYTQGLVYTYTSQSVYYQNVPSTVYTTISITSYTTSTVTAAGNTVTIPRGTTANPTTSTTRPQTTQNPSTNQGGTTAGSNAAQLSSSTTGDVTVTRPITVMATGGARRIDSEHSYATGLLGGMIWYILDFLL